MKFNVGYEITGAVRDIALKTNRQLRASCKSSPIAFTGRNAVIPHITMLMGHVRSYEDFICFKHAVLLACKMLDPVPFTMALPVWTDEGYLMSFLSPNESFRSQRYHIAEEAIAHISPTPHGTPNNPAHITLGLCERDRISSVETYVGNWSLGVEGVALRLCIFRVGQNGTCSQKYCEFDLASGAYSEFFEAESLRRAFASA